MPDKLNRTKKSSLTTIVLLIIVLFAIVAGAAIYRFILPHTPNGGSITPTGLIARTSTHIGVNTKESGASTEESTSGNVPGLNPADAVLYLEDRQFDCKEVKEEDEVYFEWYCQQETDGVLFEVALFAHNMDFHRSD